MPAKTKSELVEVTRREFEKLEQLLLDIHPGEAVTKDDDGVSIKDVVAHRAHWIGLFFSWYEDGLAGLEVSYPAKGYKWNQLAQYNADLRATQTRLSWSKAQSGLLASHKRLLSFISGSTDAELYGGPMKGAKNQWTTGRWAEAAGPSHYRSAAKYIRKRLRALRGP